MRRTRSDDTASSCRPGPKPQHPHPEENDVDTSTEWRRSVHWLGDRLWQARRALRLLWRRRRHRLTLKAMARDLPQVARILRDLPRFGTATAKARILRVLALNELDEYRSWLTLYGDLTQADRAALSRHVAAMAAPPLISVLMPVFDPAPEHLRAAIRSVTDQLYPHWELCLVDDASTDPEIARVLDEFADAPRVRIVRRACNGHVSATSNRALEAARGPFVALLDHDDLLAPHALYMVAAELEKHPDADLLYTDEDKIGPDGERFDPTFKPDWDRERLLQQNYVNHLSVFRTSLVRELGGFREGFEGSQDHDLVLRCSARTEAARIRHIPFVLYHWRIYAGAGTMSSSPTGQDRAGIAARRAVAEFLASAGELATVTASPRPGLHRVVRQLTEPAPHVTLIVPTRDRLRLLRPCLEGLLQRTSYPSLDIIIVDNGSQDAATLAYLAALGAEPMMSVLPMPGPFNFSRLNNRAVERARGPYIGLINNDIEVIEADWLTRMMSHAIRPGIGAVGAKLLYESGSVQHGGVVLGVGGVAGHAEKRAGRWDPGYVGQLALARSVSAVTAACLVVSKAAYQSVGGLDETAFAVGFNDVDFCIRLREAGYTNIWTPLAELFHKESMSRGSDLTGEKALRFAREVAAMKARWGDLLKHDPYYNPNLGLVSEDVQLAFPPRTVRPFAEYESPADSLARE